MFADLSSKEEEADLRKIKSSMHIKEKLESISMSGLRSSLKLRFEDEVQNQVW